MGFLDDAINRFTSTSDEDIAFEYLVRPVMIVDDHVKLANDLTDFLNERSAGGWSLVSTEQSATPGSGVLFLFLRRAIAEEKTTRDPLFETDETTTQTLRNINHGLHTSPIDLPPS